VNLFGADVDSTSNISKQTKGKGEKAEGKCYTRKVSQEPVACVHIPERSMSSTIGDKIPTIGRSLSSIGVNMPILGIPSRSTSSTGVTMPETEGDLFNTSSTVVTMPETEGDLFTGVTMPETEGDLFKTEDVGQAQGQDNNFSTAGSSIVKIEDKTPITEANLFKTGGKKLISGDRDSKKHRIRGRRTSSGSGDDTDVPSEPSTSKKHPCLHRECSDIQALKDD